MGAYVRESRDVTVLSDHRVFPAGYRRAVFDAAVDQAPRGVRLEIEARHRVESPEIGTDEDHAHFPVRSVPTYGVTKLVTIIKSPTARGIFRRCPDVGKKPRGGEFWTDGYLASAVGRRGDERTMGAHVKGQGSAYQRLREDRQLALF